MIRPWFRHAAVPWEDNSHPDESIWGESSLHQTRGAPDRARIGRPASAVSREVARNGPAGRYRALRAQALAEQRARRPKRAKLAGNEELRGRVQAGLGRRWSPEQVSVAEGAVPGSAGDAGVAR